VGAISKTFTWIAVMKEVEAGRIRLNQPINLYLPEKVQVRDQGRWQGGRGRGQGGGALILGGIGGARLARVLGLGRRRGWSQV